MECHAGLEDVANGRRGLSQGVAFPKRLRTLFKCCRKLDTIVCHGAAAELHEVLKTESTEHFDRRISITGNK